MDSFAVLKDGYYSGTKLELTYTDCAIYRNVMISGFPAVIILLVTTLISQRVLMRTVMIRMCFVLHTVIRIFAGKFSNALIIVQFFFLSFVTGLSIVLTAVMK